MRAPPENGQRSTLTHGLCCGLSTSAKRGVRPIQTDRSNIHTANDTAPLSVATVTNPATRIASKALAKGCPPSEPRATFTQRAYAGLTRSAAWCRSKCPWNRKSIEDHELSKWPIFLCSDRGAVANDSVRIARRLCLPTPRITIMGRMGWLDWVVIAFAAAGVLLLIARVAFSEVLGW